MKKVAYTVVKSLTAGNCFGPGFIYPAQDEQLEVDCPRLAHNQRWDTINGCVVEVIISFEATSSKQADQLMRMFYAGQEHPKQ